MREAAHSLKKFIAIFFTVLALVSISTKAQEVIHLQWPTKIAAPPVQLTPDIEKLMPVFRFSSGLLPESTTLLTSLSMPGALGVSADEAKEMYAPAEKRYTEIANSSVFRKTASAISYCFSERQPSTGFANLYLPAKVEKETPVVLFLHGFAGSFQWYLHVMAETYPDAIILAPAYGIYPPGMPPEYLFEAIDAAEKKVGHRLPPPTLVTLSAGVRAGFHAYITHPNRFESLIAIAGFPNAADLAQVLPGGSIYFLAGGNEGYVPALAKIVETLRAKGTFVRFETVPQGNHFFLLTKANDTIARLRNWGLKQKTRK